MCEYGDDSTISDLSTFIGEGVANLCGRRLSGRPSVAAGEGGKACHV